MDVVAPVRALSFMNMNSRLKVHNGGIRVNVWRYLRRLWRMRQHIAGDSRLVRCTMAADIMQE
jgi:hypothetical protein